MSRPPVLPGHAGARARDRAAMAVRRALPGLDRTQADLAAVAVIKELLAMPPSAFAAGVRALNIDLGSDAARIDVEIGMGEAWRTIMALALTGQDGAA